MLLHNRNYDALRSPEGPAKAVLWGHRRPDVSQRGSKRLVQGGQKRQRENAEAGHVGREIVEYHRLAGASDPGRIVGSRMSWRETAWTI